MAHRVLLILMSCLLSGPTLAQEDENPSNPLSKGKNTDIRAQYFDLRGGKELTNYFIDGAFMASDKLKMKYELHYWDTDITGQSEQDLESLVIKPIYFPVEG